VAPLLRQGRHDVLTPTLTGMGERAHLCRQERVGVDTHVQGVKAVLDFEDLRDVVLRGASYGGMPVTAAEVGDTDGAAGNTDSAFGVGPRW
jgi:pimeloyl-ACP methyl ester carboxylesterase